MVFSYQCSLHSITLVFISLGSFVPSLRSILICLPLELTEREFIAFALLKSLRLSDLRRKKGNLARTQRERGTNDIWIDLFERPSILS